MVSFSKRFGMDRMLVLILRVLRVFNCSLIPAFCFTPLPKVSSPLLGSGNFWLVSYIPLPYTIRSLPGIHQAGSQSVSQSDASDAVAV